MNVMESASFTNIKFNVLYNVCSKLWQSFGNRGHGAISRFKLHKMLLITFWGLNVLQILMNSNKLELIKLE